MRERKLPGLVARYRSAELDHSADQMLLAACKNELPRLSWGWSEVAVREGVLHEPDFAGDALTELRPEVELTLWVQKEAQRLHGEQGHPVLECTFRDRVILVRGALERPRYMLHRHSQPRKGISGWYLGPVEPEHIGGGDFDTVPTAALAGHRHLLPYLGFPEGTLLVFEGERLLPLENRSGL